MKDIIFISALILTVHYVYFLLVIYFGLKSLVRYSKNAETPEYAFVSVIIPFRNEEGNILDNLKSISAQSYPSEKFEVIYVDDDSNDRSADIIKANAPSNFVLVRSLCGGEVRGHKKTAIETGILNAAGDLILTTDADCRPGPGWIKSMIDVFDETTGFCAGPVDYKTEPGELFQNIQRIEFIGLILAGAGLIGAQKPAVCSAANMAFRKKVFEDLGGYNELKRFSSGDDELLMQKIFSETELNVKFCFSPDALVETKPHLKIDEFFEQRKRWASKGLFYRNKLLVIKLIFIYLFFALLILSLFMGIFADPGYFIIFILGFSLKLIAEYLIIKRGTAIYNSGVLKYFLPAQFFHLPYILYAAFAGLFGNFKWKGREVGR